MKPLEKMTKRELVDEVHRLNQVLEITARRHTELKTIVDKYQIEEMRQKWRKMSVSSFRQTK